MLPFLRYSISQLLVTRHSNYHQAAPQRMATLLAGQKRPLEENAAAAKHALFLDEIFGSSSTSPSLSLSTTTSSTITKSGWCLREGLSHIMTVDDGRMLPIVQQHGLPLIYEATSAIQKRQQRQQHCRHEARDAADENLDQLKNQPQNCFQSLCRIVAGQQLAGAAAKTVWNRLLETVEHELTPSTVLNLTERGVEQHLQKPAGLSGAKARSIVALAQAFQQDITKEDSGSDGPALSDEFLSNGEDSEVRGALLKVKGIGPWSCDMFMMFYLERANILPVGDLGVRKGIAKMFQLRGKAKGGSLCPKSDLQLMESTLEPYRPYQSLVAYYMWRVADTKDFYRDDTEKSPSKLSKLELDKARTTATPKKKRARNATKQVTP